MPKGIRKKPVRSTKRVRNAAEDSKPSETFMAALSAAANRQPQRHEESGDSRSTVLSALAQVLITQNEAIQKIADVANSAPNYTDRLIRG